MAYAELEPFGQPALSWQIATVAATVANSVRDPKKKHAPFQPSDFMPEPPLTRAEKAARLRAKFDTAMMAFGGRARRPGEPRRAKGRRPGRPEGETPVRRGGRKVAEARPRRGT